MEDEFPKPIENNNDNYFRVGFIFEPHVIGKEEIPEEKAELKEKLKGIFNTDERNVFFAELGGSDSEELDFSQDYYHAIRSFGDRPDRISRSFAVAYGLLAYRSMARRELINRKDAGELSDDEERKLRGILALDAKNLDLEVLDNIADGLKNTDESWQLNYLSMVYGLMDELVEEGYEIELWTEGGTRTYVSVYGIDPQISDHLEGSDLSETAMKKVARFISKRDEMTVNDLSKLRKYANEEKRKTNAVVIRGSLHSGMVDRLPEDMRQDVVLAESLHPDHMGEEGDFGRLYQNTMDKLILGKVVENSSWNQFKEFIAKKNAEIAPE